VTVSAGEFALAAMMATDQDTIDLRQDPARLRAAAEDAFRLGGDSPEERAALAAVSALRHLLPAREQNSPVFREGEESNWRARSALHVIKFSLVNEGVPDRLPEYLLDDLAESLASLLHAVDSARAERTSIEATRLTPDERVGVLQLAATLARREASAETGQQLMLEGFPPADPIVVRAYMACALTRCDETQHHSLTTTHRLLAQRLEEEFGIQAHVPSDYTDPRRNPDMPPGDVHATDYSAVLSSDLLIVNSAEPSFGGGKEITWAEANGAIVLIASPMASPTSRLIVGSPAEPREIWYTSPADLEQQVLRFVRDNLALLRARAAQRVLRLFPRTLRLLQSGDFDPDAGYLTQRRFDELTRSSTFLAAATLTEVCEAVRMAGLPLADVLEMFAAEQNRSSLVSPLGLGPAPLTRAQIAALTDATQINEWSGLEVAELVDRALVSLGKSGHYRRPFTTVEDWEGLKGP
jgi:hypothetical protein